MSSPFPPVKRIFTAQSLEVRYLHGKRSEHGRPPFSAAFLLPPSSRCVRPPPRRHTHLIPIGAAAGNDAPTPAAITPSALAAHPRPSPMMRMPASTRDAAGARRCAPPPFHRACGRQPRSASTSPNVTTDDLFDLPQPRRTRPGAFLRRRLSMRVRATFPSHTPFQRSAEPFAPCAETVADQPPARRHRQAAARTTDRTTTVSAGGPVPVVEPPGLLTRPAHQHTSGGSARAPGSSVGRFSDATARSLHGTEDHETSTLSHRARQPAPTRPHGGRLPRPRLRKGSVVRSTGRPLRHDSGTPSSPARSPASSPVSSPGCCSPGGANPGAYRRRSTHRIPGRPDHRRTD